MVENCDQALFLNDDSAVCISSQRGSCPRYHIQYIHKAYSLVSIVFSGLLRFSVPNPSVPACANHSGQNPHPGISYRSDCLCVLECQTALDSIYEQKHGQNRCLSDQGPSASIKEPNVGFDGFRQACGGRVERVYWGDRSSGGANRWIEQKRLRCNPGCKDLPCDRDWVLIMSNLERGDDKVGDQECGQDARFDSRPYRHDKHANGEKRGRCLHLEALEQETVAERSVRIMNLRLRAQEICR